MTATTPGVPRSETFRDVPRVFVRYAIAAAAVSWIPLLLLATAEAIVLRRPATVQAFAADLATHVRYLVAAPLLVIGDALTESAIARCERHLKGSGLVSSGETRLPGGIERCQRLRRSGLAAVLLLAIVVVVTVASRGADRGDWFELPTTGESRWSALWLGLVAVPLFRFLLLRWLFRWLVWAGFLVWMTRLDLDLAATHPDRCGGLAFLTVPVSAALAVVFGVSAAVGMTWRHAIVYHAASVRQVRDVVLLLGAMWLAILLGPFVAFAPRLLRLKRIAVIEYSGLGDAYTHAFQRKWVAGPRTRENLLGTPDIQSLADLQGAMDLVNRLRATPIDLHLALSVVIVYAFALLPVILSQISLEQLLTRVVRVVV